ncbi:MAG TPA: transposase [Pirellulales bacterium]|nr:transposase [Pirellulales bacterium]
MVPQRRIDEQHEPMWRMSDELWNRVYPILLESSPPRKGPGRKPADWRRVLNGIVFRLRTGCHWNKLPAEFGDDSTIHRWYQRWTRSGLLPRILAELQSECGDLPDAAIESFAQATAESCNA